MPKIFLIKNRLHQQQLRLQESQNLLSAKDDDRLGGLNTSSVGGESSSGSSDPYHHLHHHHHHGPSSGGDDKGQWRRRFLFPCVRLCSADERLGCTRKDEEIIQTTNPNSSFGHFDQFWGL